MTSLQIMKGVCVLVSLALASLLTENLIPLTYIPHIAWISGALAAAPAHMDRLFGYISVHRSTIPPPAMPATTAAQRATIPTSEWDETPYDPEGL